MESEIIKALSGNGPFVILFFVMLWWVLRTNEKREGQYQQTIDKLADSLQCVEAIKDDVKDLKNWLASTKQRLGVGS